MDDDASRAEARWARSFGSVAQAYDRGRPGYPAAAAAWLVGREAAVVLELGAGTGKLTAELVSQGHDVHATDPDDRMLEILRARVPLARASVAAAESLPTGDRSVDVVVAAQSFHWFDHDAALSEIARVLKPGGALALVWNHRDVRIPWVRRLGELIGTQEQLVDPTDVLLASALFEPPESTTFMMWQEINRDSLVDLVSSRSNVAVLDDAGREAKLAEVAAFYDDFGRGYDGMQLPYVTHCFRARVVDQLFTRSDDAAGDGAGEDPAASSRNDGSGTDNLLIDFR